MAAAMADANRQTSSSHRQAGAFVHSSVEMEGDLQSTRASSVGCVVGMDVGSDVGEVVGDRDGEVVGDGVGARVGSAVGSGVGDRVGSVVGSAVGSAVVGSSVVGDGVTGCSVGTSVGLAVGRIDGPRDGAGVSALRHPFSSQTHFAGDAPQSSSVISSPSQSALVGTVVVAFVVVVAKPGEQTVPPLGSTFHSQLDAASHACIFNERT
mmetsp:Transcript_29018/g.69986  ORF Transcript_29018/g.69986 Transcript_29018/m.69986 type:complete len:209 (-) Transcript_29018:668-1294(-)